MFDDLPVANEEEVPHYLSVLPFNLIASFEFPVAPEADDDDDEDEDPDDPDNTGDDDDEDDDDPDAGGDKGKGKKSKDDDPEGKGRAARQAARYRTQRNEARAELERIKAKHEGDKEASEKLVEAEARAEEAEQKLRQAGINLAVVKHSSKLKFRDVEDAIAHVERKLGKDVDEEDVDDEVKELLEGLAKAKPYLLETDKPSDDDDEDDDEPKPPSGSSTRKKKKSKHELDEDALAKKFPALATR